MQKRMIASILVLFVQTLTHHAQTSGPSGRQANTLGVGDVLVTESSKPAHSVQVWRVLPEFAKPGRYRLSVQHAATGHAGAFRLVAWEDSDGDGIPDKRIGRSREFKSAKAGEWSEWEFAASTASVFVGNSWSEQTKNIFYSRTIPDGYTGLSDEVYFSRSEDKAPVQHTRPRFTNLRLTFLDGASTTTATLQPTPKVAPGTTVQPAVAQPAVAPLLAQEPPPKPQSTATVQPTLDDPFVVQVAALPAEQQLQAVVSKLKELNPGFDVREQHKIEGGQVTELAFSTASVKDLAPLKALKELKKLTLLPWPAPGTPAGQAVTKGILADLSPLQGLPLTFLACGNTQVADLAPLKGMPLTILSVDNTTVQDLSVLAGMPLTLLWCQNTKVADLSPLRGAPLKELRCDPAIAASNAQTLRSIGSLGNINGLSAANFLARLSASASTQASTRPPIVYTTPAPTILPAQQIQQFIAKMKQLNPQFRGVPGQGGIRVDTRGR